MKRRMNRTKVEMFKAKVAFILMLIAIACADSGILFQLIAVFALLWLWLCASRLEKRGALDE